MLSGYHGSPPFLISPLSAISKETSAKVEYARGVNISGTNVADIPGAIDLAKRAEVVIVGIGLCGNNYLRDADDTCSEIDESEATSRKNTTLPFVQKAPPGTPVDRKASPHHCLRDGCRKHRSFCS